MFDEFEKYERFVYRATPGGDLAPPHGIWDAALNEWTGIGTWSTEAEARACAVGMNWAREKSQQGKRGLRAVAAALQAIVAKIQ
jgi:hypothetical protein